MPLNVEKYAISTQTNGIPLICPMKRYTDTLRMVEDRHAPGVILLLGHGAGFFKETWEPTIEDIFALDKKRKRVREVWALDCQNHGEACVLNEDILVRTPEVLTIWDYAEAFASLYKSGLFGPLNPELHKVVLCGHSAGSVAVTLSTSYFNPPFRIPYSSLILVDPPIWGREKEDQDSEVYKMVAAMTPVRKDVWKSNEEAAKWLGSRMPWGSWDKRILEKYTKYGIRTLPTAFYPDRNEGVTLTTHRSCENIAFTGKRFAYDALNRLNQICEHVPVHLIYGENNDMFERDVQDSLINPQERRTFASIVRIEDAGHLVVQEAPTKVAGAIYEILLAEYTNNKGITNVSSKL
ncbi:hypothetical protein D9613_011251 [Agrocybe pediades]|uniref:AB hydrolase-1 domain-containing protein n=1 Tax=Agrocybe pediades TaxID=84607 RepID=A0A8H4VPV1_9AGAR|nr:hypothetical protein D9613_011251 [Agrocybe pediades]